MWRNLKFINMWTPPHLSCIEIWNFSTLPMFSPPISKVRLTDNLAPNCPRTIGDIGDKYEVWSYYLIMNSSSWQWNFIPRRRQIHFTWFFKSVDLGRTRTCNPLIRSQMPYPLGHKTLCYRPSTLLQVYLTNLQHVMQPSLLHWWKPINTSKSMNWTELQCPIDTVPIFSLIFPG